MQGPLAATAVGLAALAAWLATACQPTGTAIHWTCDFDASETRPLSDFDAAATPDGALPSAVCEDTCGTPATTCTFALLDGGVPGAHCPVCTF